MLLGMACLTIAGAAGGRAARAADATLSETGSTLMLPLMRHWADGYRAASEGVTLTTAGTGSGAGIAAAEDGSAAIGASDAYMSDVEIMRHPGTLNIPLAISAQTVTYNLPGITAPLRLTGPVLAAIYAGSITDWGDPRIAAANPGVALPHHPIVPVRRADSAGDTFIFTQFLTFSTPDWEAGPGFGTTIAWPAVPGMLTATGNDGMVQALAHTPYAIGYVGISFAGRTAEAGLGNAALLNEAGAFVLPDARTVQEAAAALTPRTPPDERLTLAFAPGAASYPLINYEYAIVRAHQPNAAQAKAIRDFLLWAVTPSGGNADAYLKPVRFIALPTAIRALSETQISTIR
jgi:phosphate transport system substrate-binding protein